MTRARKFRAGDYQIAAQEITAGMQFYCEGHTYEVLTADLIGWMYYALEVRTARGTYKVAAQATMKGLAF